MARKPKAPKDSANQLASRSGDADPLGALFPVAYEELYSLARNARRRWHGNVTLNATAIVNEAYIKLVDQRGLNVESRGAFLAVAARAMRQILCNYARDRRRLKRGGGAELIPLDETVLALPIDVSVEQAAQLSALDKALKRLEQVNARQSRVVECRFFGGLSIEETADALGLSQATVKRDWTIARTWLYREISEPVAKASKRVP